MPPNQPPNADVLIEEILRIAAQLQAMNGREWRQPTTVQLVKLLIEKSIDLEGVLFADQILGESDGA